MPFRLVFAILLLIATIVLMMIRRVRFEGQTYSLRPYWIGTGIAFLFFLMLACIRIIGPGEVGIPVVFGSAGTPIQSGVHLTNPLTDVKRMNIRTQEYTMSSANKEGSVEGNDAVEALGADGASINIDATVLYHLDKPAASRVYRQLGTDYVGPIIRPTIRTAIRDAAAAYAAVEDATVHRDDLAKHVEDVIRSQLRPRGLTLEAFQMRKVSLSQGVQQSVDNKVQAQQSAQQQEFELQKTIKAAEVRRQDARGLADSQAIIQQSLTPLYLQYLYIDSLKAMVNSPNHSTVILPFDQKLTPQLLLPNETK